MENEEEMKQKLDAILHKHKDLMSGLVDRIGAAKIDPADAEVILLWIVGTSVAMRQEQVASDMNMFVLAKAWQYTASKTAN